MGQFPQSVQVSKSTVRQVSSNSMQSTGQTEIGDELQLTNLRSVFLLSYAHDERSACI
jgi:hypothetical protein